MTEDNQLELGDNIKFTNAHGYSCIISVDRVWKHTVRAWMPSGFYVILDKYVKGTNIYLPGHKSDPYAKWQYLPEK